MTTASQPNRVFAVPANLCGLSRWIVDDEPSSRDDYRPGQVPFPPTYRFGTTPFLPHSNDERRALFMRIIERWLMMRPVPSLDALLAETGLSRRHVERRCKALFGNSPKALARQVRALRAAAAIARTSEPTDDFFEYGFYDQPHMIREVKRYTGMTPGQIRARRTPPAGPGHAMARL